MLAQAEDVATTYEPPDVNVQLTFRVPASTRALLEAVIQVWQLLAKARGEAVSQVDLSHICRRLLRVGADQALAEFGIKVDDVLSGEVDWKEVEKIVADVVRKSKR